MPVAPEQSPLTSDSRLGVVSDEKHVFLFGRNGLEQGEKQTCIRLIDLFVVDEWSIAGDAFGDNFGCLFGAHRRMN